ncbi:hypothetical protein HHI36_018559 [Cryptolaemus montrouzieri]|uniref:protein acetyllysine N-acetyltransferase n=1 Tax=Cryptolaemus montrouzieri TaxID=559131 RepID=A0ABD2P152_9CUCU
MCEEWEDMESNFKEEIDISEKIEEESQYAEKHIKRYRLPRANKIQSKKLCVREQKNASLKKIAVILQKCASDRTFEEEKVLNDCSEEVKEVRLRWKRRDDAKRRLEEYEDPPEVLKNKCEKLAQAIAQAQHLVVYTGAGISTSAKIPDYRGPNGIWTRLQQGKDIGNHDLTLAEPTYTHMALFELYKKNILKYVVSQNCDGLHLRSGLPRTALSELHGNMYLEVCKNCRPHKEYWRTFDVTENTSRYFHKTFRKCYTCNSPLVDTIVHFGERGTLQWPLNWRGACNNAKKATTIVCLGSSLRVLKKYPWLWQMDKPARRRPNLYIVNLQWTPKDECANVKINGRCDEVMKQVLGCLGITPGSYDKTKDPIYSHCSRLSSMEMHTTTQPFLKDMKQEKDEAIDEKPSTPQVQSIDGDNKDCKENHHKDDLIENKTSTPTGLCDKVRNSNNTGSLRNSNLECLPKKEETPFHSVFSIDSILKNSSVEAYANSSSSQVSIQNCVVSNLVLNPFIDFNDYNHRYFQNEIYKTMTDYYYYSYPYQSSWLYSGLHSIINPVPYIKEEVKLEDEEIEVRQPSCEFCYDNLKSFDCLFYMPVESVFTQQQYRYSKIEQKEKPNICVCCDYTTDEDEIGEKDDENKEMNTSDRSRVQPGWFGKGYKKGRYRRRY